MRVGVWPGGEKGERFRVLVPRRFGKRTAWAGSSADRTGAAQHEKNEKAEKMARWETGARRGPGAGEQQQGEEGKDGKQMRAGEARNLD